jgi:hypothetical protein
MSLRTQLLLITASFLLVGCNAAEPLNSLDEGVFAAPPETMSVRIMGYVPQAGQTFQNLFVSNFSVNAYQGELHWSTSRDGMSDTLKQSLAANYGFSVLSPESVVIGFADLLLYFAGITTPQQALMFCSSIQSNNSANDAFVYNDARIAGSPSTFLGLRDCDKLYMGLNPQNFDFNKNGIPDYLELRCGMNPLDPNEAFLSTAGDGVSNFDKCKRGIPLAESASTQPNQLFAYQYDTEQNPDGSYNFTVSNIPILNDGDQNFLTFSITESNSTTSNTALYTAFAIVKAGYTGKTLQFNYWATTPAQFTGQEIVVP